jgi:acyl-CoA hydrolase
MIFVSVDDKGSSTPVRELVPRTLGEELEQQWAMNRVALRREVEAAMAREQYTDAGSAPRVVLRFLAAPTDVNWGGKVHGGIVMRWIDEAAHVLATQWTGNAQQRRDLHRRGAVLPTAADRPRRRGRGPAAAHRHDVDAHRGARALG